MTTAQKNEIIITADYQVTIYHRNSWCEQKHGAAFLKPIIDSLLQKINSQEVTQNGKLQENLTS